MLVRFWLLSSVHALAARTAVLQNAGLQCTFTVKDFEFDLCPLFGSHKSTFEIEIDEETPPTRTKNVYVVNFDGPLRQDGTLPAELQCPDGTRICLTVINTRPNHPSEPSRILQVIPVTGDDIRPTVKLGIKDEGEEHAPLQLTLHGGSYKSQRQKATIFFHCDTHAEEPTHPTFAYTFNGTHAFSWRSAHACHKALSNPVPEPGKDEDPPAQPPEDPDLEEPESPKSNGTGSFVVPLLLITFLLLVFSRLRLSYPFTTKALPPQISRIYVRLRSSLARISGSAASWKEDRHSTQYTKLSRYRPAYQNEDGGEAEVDLNEEEAPLSPVTPGTPSRYGSF